MIIPCLFFLVKLTLLLSLIYQHSLIKQHQLTTYSLKIGKYLVKTSKIEIFGFGKLAIIDTFHNWHRSTEPLRQCLAA